MHLAVAGPHFADSWLLGAGFVAVGWAQLSGAAALIRSGGGGARWLLSMLNAASIVVWGLSRTVGLPLGHPGAEAAGTADILTVSFEVVAVAVLIAGPRLVTGTRGRHAIVAISIWALPLVGSAFAIASLADGHHGATQGPQTQHPHASHGARHGEAMRSSVDEPAATGKKADDVAPRFRPSAADDVSASGSQEPDEEGGSQESDEAHTHAPGEGH